MMRHQGAVRELVCPMLQNFFVIKTHRAPLLSDTKYSRPNEEEEKKEIEDNRIDDETSRSGT